MSGHYPSRRAVFLSVMAGVAAFGSDRAHKFVQLELFDWTGGEYYPVTGFFNYVLVWNTGISYGLLSGLSPLVLAGVMGLAMLLLAVWWARARGAAARFGLALCLGGALSHLIDRLVYGAVADFFHFYWGNWSFYVFNLADTAITLGVILLIADMIWPQGETPKP